MTGDSWQLAMALSGFVWYDSLQQEPLNYWEKALTFPDQCTLQQVRHPNVLAFKDTLEVEEKSTTALYVITEPVAPLTEVLQQLDVERPARQDHLPSLHPSVHSFVAIQYAG